MQSVPIRTDFQSLRRNKQAMVIAITVLRIAVRCRRRGSGGIGLPCRSGVQHIGIHRSDINEGFIVFVKTVDHTSYIKPIGFALLKGKRFPGLIGILCRLSVFRGENQRRDHRQHHTQCQQDTKYSFLHIALPPFRYCERYLSANRATPCFKISIWVFK